MRATIIFILFFFSCVLGMAEVSTPFEAIRQHREWMSKNTPKPETLSDEDLMLHAQQIIDLRLQEPEAFDILVAASKKVPEVEAYINWTATLDCDTLFHRKRDAFRGMADYLDSTRPGCYAARKLRTEWLYVESMYRNVLPDYDALIKRQENVCRKISGKDKKEKALLLSMKIARFEARNNIEMVDNPMYYPEIWQLEEDVINLYPIASTDTVADRMQLYTQIAGLKSIPQEDLRVRVMLGDDKDPFNNGTLYEYTGRFRDYLCNSGFYYDKAYEMSEKLFGSYHPVTASSAYFCSQFRIYNTTIGNEELDRAKAINDFFSMYYPRHSNEGKICRLLKANADLQRTGNPGLTSEKDEILEIAKLTYGENNTYYINILSQITNFALFSEPDFNASLNKYEEECRRVFPDALKQDLWLLYNYGQVIFRDAAEGKERMAKLKDSYLANNDGSLISIKVGEDIATYYQNTAYDLDVAKEIYTALASDIEKMYGKHSSMYYITCLNLFNVTAEGINDAEVSYLSNIINDAEKHDFTGKQLTLSNLRSAYAGYFWSTGRYDKAHAIYKKLYTDPRYRNPLPAKVRDAVCRMLSGKDMKDADSFVAGIRSEIDTIPHNELPPRLISELAQYYSGTNRAEEAVKLLERALEAHNYQMNEAIDDEYFDISSELSRLYEATNNRVAASRLITADREMIRNAHLLVPSKALAEYLFDGYYRALTRQDWNSAFFYVGAAFNIVSQITTSSGMSQSNMITLGLPCIQALTTLCVRIHYEIKQMKEYLESEDFKQYNVNMEALLSQITRWYPEIKNGLGQIERAFPDYDPKYQESGYYLTFLNSSAAFYQVCEPDYKKSEDYLLECLKVSKYPSEIKNTYLNLAGLMTEAGDSVKNDKYLRLAYDVIEKNPHRMADSDLMGAMTFRFNDRVKNNDISGAATIARNIYTENRRMLDGNFQLMSSSEQEQFFNTFGDPAWALASLLEKNPESLAAETYNAVVYRTGMQLRSQQETRRIIMASEDPNVHLIADSIASLRAALKQINVTPDQWMTQQGSGNYQKSSKLNFELEHLEMQLLDLTADVRSKSNPDITWQMIRDALKPNQVAVEYIISGTKVMALVLKPDCTAPIPVSLCSWRQLSKDLDALKAKNSATLAKRLYRKQASVDLYSMLWQPLESVLESSKTVYFNAPGILHSIAFNAIETPDGSYLIDKYDLRQLTTTAQITFPEDERAPKSAGLLGDVIFDPSQAKLAGIIPDVTGERAIEDDYALDEFDSRGVSRQYFRYLPFTGKELKEISTTFGQQKVKMVVRENATESELRNLCATSPEVLHLATHGFFISSEQDALHVPFMKRYSSQVGSAMQRSGVALANAEATWKGSEELPENNDGILTANEVSNLNLKNTRLVTLSACETALGAYNFEGIHGLTRGFKQAGAKSLLVSLWSVNDQSTATFMTEFYRHWIENGDRHAAYRSAVAAVRKQYPSPFYWAPFILLD